jgi:Protein kinase domain
MVGELQPGDPQSAGPYRLLGRLGSGGMGRVYLGRSPAGRLVAIKIIRPELAGDSGFRIRFAREVAAARNVSGLFTALIVDADTDGPIPWLATAYVAGPSLAEAVEEQGPLPAASVLTLAAGLAEGLEAIHEAGLVHRDLKPSNVLLAHDGPRVIDFGISRAAEATMLTQPGMVTSTPGFLSPEQAEGGVIGPPSDVFNLGAVLTFAATGEGPFATGSTQALIYRVIHNQPDISQVPEQIRALVGRCLAKNPADRPATSDLLAELGGSQFAGDWLPAALTEVLSRYGQDGAAANGPLQPIILAQEFAAAAPSYQRALLTDHADVLLTKTVADALDELARQDGQPTIGAQRAAALLDLARVGQAGAVFDALAEPSQFPRLLHTLATHHSADSVGPAALVACTAATSDAEAATAVFYLAVAVAASGDQDEARDLISEARAADPAQVPAWINGLAEIGQHHPGALLLIRALTGPAGQSTSSEPSPQDTP